MFELYLSTRCQIEGVRHPREEEEEQSCRLHHREQNQYLERGTRYNDVAAFFFVSSVFLLLSGNVYENIHQ